MAMTVSHATNSENMKILLKISETINVSMGYCISGACPSIVIPGKIAFSTIEKVELCRSQDDRATVLQSKVIGVPISLVFCTTAAHQCPE
jgi:hypothetical protein